MAWCDVVEPRTLRACRIALGQSQAAFAATLGASPESYRTWDAGRRATEVGVQDPEHHDGARDTRWRDDRMTGRRSHGRLSALNGVVHQGRGIMLTVQLTSLDQDEAN